mmetsp:Transcript_11346/g.42360  ORF Transcript_11346/g.42360 Transcript_11346/m.42360 type:complete len:119 (+) Transcript_11346:92-448(+)
MIGKSIYNGLCHLHVAWVATKTRSLEWPSEAASGPSARRCLHVPAFLANSSQQSNPCSRASFPESKRCGPVLPTEGSLFPLQVSDYSFDSASPAQGDAASGSGTPGSVDLFTAGSTSA